MRRNGEQRLRHLAHVRLVEVVKVLRSKDHSGLLLAHSLEAVADVLYCRRIIEPYIQLVERGDGVALGQKPIGHITENVEEHGVLNVFPRHQEALYAEHKKAR